MDESAHGNTGTVYGAGTTCTNDSMAGTGSFYFDNSGQGNYVDVGYGSILQLTGPYTLAAWIKPEVPGSAGAPGIIGKAHDSASEYGLMWAPGGAVAFISSGSDSLSYMWTTNGVAPAGEWRHVVGVLEGSGADQAKIYVNGELILQGTMRLPWAGEDALYIGRWHTDYYYKGNIDDPRIYDCALTATQVQQLYSNTLSYATSNGIVFRVDDTNAVLTGGLTVQSSLSAASFSGDGAGLTGIGSSGISSGAISSAKLADGAVTTNKLAEEVWTANDARYVNSTGDTVAGTVTLQSGLIVNVTATIVRLEKQGDIGMGSYINGP